MKAALFVLLSFITPPGSIDFRKEFGSDYSWALQWLSFHNSQVEKYANQYSIPAKELKAIVFPELIRYNRVFDAIQIESLKFLYVSEGKNYADFSVGYFQMKPSFAERVEKDVKEISGNIPGDIRQWGRGAENNDSRRARVMRITHIEDQLNYLCAFYKICESKFASHHFESAIDRVRFFATCYNAGYHLSEAEILNFQTRNHFYKYNYSAVSAYYFENE